MGAYKTLAELLAEHERQIILDALESVGHRYSAAARLLGITREGLYKKCKRLDILTSRQRRAAAQQAQVEAMLREMGPLPGEREG